MHGGVQITWVDFDLIADRIEVSSRFLARMPGGEWETIWKASKQAAASNAPADLITELGDNPQVKQTLEMARQLGAGDAVTKALQFGAATKVAQDDIMRRFSDFLELHRRAARWSAAGRTGQRAARNADFQRNQSPYRKWDARRVFAELLDPPAQHRTTGRGVAQ